jgi:hypothetical protein
VKSNDITKLIKDVPADYWVVLNADRTKLLASAKTLAAAMKKAKPALQGERPLIFQVPDPDLACLY